jgi:chromosome segregation ATPase
MSGVTTGEKFFRGLSDCQQLFKDRESELLAEVNFYAEKVESRDEEIEKLKHTVAEKNCEIYRLSKRLSSNGRGYEASDEVEGMKNMVQEMTAVIAENKETLDEKNADIVAKEQIIDELKQKIADLRVAEDYQDVIIAKKDEQIDDLKKSIESQNGVVESQNQALAKMDDELFIKEKQLDERDAKIRDLTGQLAEKEREVKRKTKLAEDLQKVFELSPTPLSPFVHVPLRLRDATVSTPVSKQHLAIW